MGLLVQNFEMVEYPPSRERRVYIPGYNGPIVKRLNWDMPVLIHEFGKCTTDYVSTIVANRGDATATTTVSTPLLGDFVNCYKLHCRTRSIRTSTGGIVAYDIWWEQLSFVT